MTYYFHDEKNKLTPGGCLYGKTVVWTHGGQKYMARAINFLEPERAIKYAFNLAEQAGYTAPQWWQFWRWNDTRPPKGEPA